MITPLDGARMDQVLRRADGSYQPAAAQLCFESGLGLSVPVPSAAVPVVLDLEGERPLRVLIDSAATSTSLNAAEISTQSLATARNLAAGLVEWRQDS